jgi:hypothetical protein
VTDWDLIRDNKGNVNEAAEQERCRRLLSRVPQQTVQVSSGPRNIDKRFSWEPVNRSAPNASQLAEEKRLAKLREICNPPRCLLNHDAFEKLLARHPDRLKIALLLDMIRNGANVGYDGPRDTAVLTNNHARSEEQLKLLREDIAKEQKLGRTSPWFDEPPYPNFHVSPLSVTDKTENGSVVGKRRITDASSPAGSSLNDFILRLVCRVASFDQALELIRLAGKGCKLAKIDVKSAFRIILVRSEDWHLLGITMDGKLAFDYVLPFGLRSSPPLWDRVASALCWILNNVLGIRCIYHVDDFLLVFPASENAEAGFEVAKREAFLSTNTPMSVDKEKPPATVNVYNGIQLDTVRMIMSVTIERKAAAVQLIKKVLQQKTISRRKMQSLCGKLAFLCRAVPVGRVFMNRALAVLRLAQNNKISVSSEMRKDLDWWLRFLPEWQGTAAIPTRDWTAQTTIKFNTDASTGQGMGAVFGKQWVSHMWSPDELKLAQREEKLSAPFLELAAIAIAIDVWGSTWSGERVTVFCDCMPVVAILNKGSSRSDAMVALLRSITSIAIHHNFEIRAAHVPGRDNLHCDLLSRNQVEAFLKSSGTSALYRRTPPHGLSTLCC